MSSFDEVVVLESDLFPQGNDVPLTAAELEMVGGGHATVNTI